VVSARDGVLYRSDVLSASLAPTTHLPWSRPVLILLAIRLGLDGVNPVYYPSLKALFSFPQSVGIAGGRPSSSYYFVGVQGDGVFYIDPHHTKPTVPLQPVPSSLTEEAQTRVLGASGRSTIGDEWEKVEEEDTSESFVSAHEAPSTTKSNPENVSKDSLDDFFIQAYPPSAFDSFHCEKVRKMNMSGLDPSMLVGFLCRDEDAWNDLCSRLKEVSLYFLRCSHSVRLKS
jgi:hypothetical protein